MPDSRQRKKLVERYNINRIKLQNILLLNATTIEMPDVVRLSKGFYREKASYGNESAQQRILKN